MGPSRWEGPLFNRLGSWLLAMDGFSRDMLRLGTLTGFQYFSCYLRGREELLVTINREAPTVDGHPSSPQQGLQVAPSPRKPISPDPMGKPPASPASREITSASDNECVFLVGAYQRYKSPFVWLRSGHLETYSGQDRDVPLRLQSTAEWSSKKGKVWEVIAELVAITVRPRPTNPFQINFAHLENLQTVHATLCTGALLGMLREILSQVVSPSSALDREMLDDMLRLSDLHFGGLGGMAQEYKALQSSPT